MKKIRKIGVLALAAVCALSAGFAAVYKTSVDTYAADSLKEQEINYTELVGRVNQSDSGFTKGSTTAFSLGNDTFTKPFTGDKARGFQFYYLGLEKWSSGRSDVHGSDGDIEQWYLDSLDGTLANLRANGGACIIRACYAINGQTKPEPAEFETITRHQQQLAAVFRKYHDVIVGVECGMIGAYGEMHSSRYDDHKTPKFNVLNTWLTELPDDITVNVRTLDEYIFYLNYSDVYKNKYKGKTVNGISYPEEVTKDNCAQCVFKDEVFNRIGFYNDGMIQDWNDAGTFSSSRSDFVKILNQKSDRIAYGGEFSGNADKYRFEDDTWMPLNAIPEFYNEHICYYHGGNAAYWSYGKYKTGQTWSKNTYTDSTAATAAANRFKSSCKSLGSGMTYSASASGKTVNYSVGGWNSGTVGDALINKLQNDSNVTADLSVYEGQSVASFFEDHLGYRLVLKQSLLSEKVKVGGQLTLEGKIDNTGFTNINREKVCQIILSDDASGTNMYILDVDDIDAADWTGGSSNDYSMTIGLPEDIKPGNYQVYLRVASRDADGNVNKASCVRFANPGNFSNSVLGTDCLMGASTVSIIYNPDICGNYIGTFEVIK